MEIPQMERRVSLCVVSASILSLKENAIESGLRKAPFLPFVLTPDRTEKNRFSQRRSQSSLMDVSLP